MKRTRKKRGKRKRGCRGENHDSVREMRIHIAHSLTDEKLSLVCGRLQSLRKFLSLLVGDVLLQVGQSRDMKCRSHASTLNLISSPT